MSRTSRISRIKVNNDSNLSEKKDIFPVHSNKRKVIVGVQSENNKQKDSEEKAAPTVTKKEKQDKTLFKKKGRMKFSKSVSLESSVDADNSSFFPEGTIQEDFEDFTEEERISNVEEVKEENPPEEHHNEIKKPEEKTAPKPTSKFGRNKNKKRNFGFGKEKNIVNSDGSLKKTKEPQPISETVKSDEDMVHDFSIGSPQVGQIKGDGESDIEIIIRPYSSFDPDNGVYKKDAHQETSNIRFTESDRVLAEKSGLSWD